MRSIFIMYMPGHAGHMMSRLFGLSPEAMPLLERTTMQTADMATVNKLDAYKFNDVKARFKTWQHFHREYADHKDSNTIRIANAVGGHQYSCVIYPIHPFEFHNDFQELDETECYYVDLDLATWGNWVEQQRRELKFVDRKNEREYFEEHRTLHNMQPINLTKMLSGAAEFQEEYLRVATAMQITPVLNQATALFTDWKAVRVPQ